MSYLLILQVAGSFFQSHGLPFFPALLFSFVQNARYQLHQDGRLETESKKDFCSVAAYEHEKTNSFYIWTSSQVGWMMSEAPF